MAKRSKDRPGNDSETSTIAAVRKVAELMSSTSDELQQIMRSHAAAIAAAPVAAGVEVNSWDDPFNKAAPTDDPSLVSPRVTTLPASPPPALSISISDPQPAAAGRYDPGTPEFRYWVTVEALWRGIAFWSSLLPAGTTWSTSNPMQVSLVEAGETLNANYMRRLGLRFYHQKVLAFDIYSCESPDVVCHELGHAVLDALRPQLFDGANTETSAFHESFGDMSAILCALQVPAMRAAVKAETGSRLNVSSSLSRLAVQLGWGLRKITQGVDPDCMRNAANHFFYVKPDLLPPLTTNADQLSQEEHSFSRVFTGAFLDALARMYSAASTQDDAGLIAISRDMARLVIDAVHGAPITDGYFSQIAAAMIQADRARSGGRYNAELTGAFLEHGILSVESSLQLAGEPMPTAIVPGQGAGAVADPGGGAAMIYSYPDRANDDAHHLGFGQTPDLPIRPLDVAKGVAIHVHASTEQPRFAVTSATRGPDRSAAPGIVADDASSQDSAVRTFVEGLIQRQQVDLTPVNKSVTGAGRKHAGRTTHELVAKDGKMVLKRRYFSCGCGHASLAAPVCGV